MKRWAIVGCSMCGKPTPVQMDYWDINRAQVFSRCERCVRIMDKINNKEPLTKDEKEFLRMMG